MEEVLSVARAGLEAGCTEALFTLGDKPELVRRRQPCCFARPACSAYFRKSNGPLFARTGEAVCALQEYPEAAEELRALGHESTLSYAIEAAAAVLNETGLLPHMNAGLLTAEEYGRSRQARGVSINLTPRGLHLAGWPPADVPCVAPPLLRPAGLRLTGAHARVHLSPPCGARRAARRLPGQGALRPARLHRRRG